MGEGEEFRGTAELVLDSGGNPQQGHEHDLGGHGVEASEAQEVEWGRFVYFADPDGNTWSLQELPKRR